MSITGSTTLCKDCNSSLRTTQLSPSSGGTWKSNNPSVATVDNTGLVTARGAGSVTFTFTDSLTGYECETDTVRVKSPPPPNIKHAAKLDDGSKPQGASLQVTATFTSYLYTSNPLTVDIYPDSVISTASGDILYYSLDRDEWDSDYSYEAFFTVFETGQNQLIPINCFCYV